MMDAGATGSSAMALMRSVKAGGSKTVRMATVTAQRWAERPLTSFVHEVGQLRRTGAIDAAEATRLLATRGIEPGSFQHAAVMSDAARGRVLLTWGGKLNLPPLFHLRGELRARGATVQIVNNADLALRDCVLLAKGRPIPMPDAIVARGVKAKYLPMFEDLASQGVHLVNQPDAIRSGRSKAAMAGIFEAAGVKAPKTIVVKGSDDLARAADEIGLPMIVKTSRGSGGNGVFKVDTPADLDEIRAQLLGGDRPRLLVAQEFIEGSAGIDNRVMVVRRPDGEHQVVAVMERRGSAGDFRANGPSGNAVRRIDPTGADPAVPREYLDTAVKAARAFDLDVAGVDVGRTGHVWEINTTAGLPELDTFMPRREHTLPRIADYAVYGTRNA